MYAAASGKSNIGIPKKVAQEFVAADKPGKLPERKMKSHALGGYIKGGDERIQEDRPRGGPALTTKSRFYKNYPDVYRTSIEEQEYKKGEKAHGRPKGKGKEEEEQD